MAAQMQRLDWLLLVGLSIVWGGSFLFNGIAVREVPVLTIVAARVAIASVILLLVALLRGEPLPRGGDIWGRIFAVGAINSALPFALIVYAQRTISSGEASILNASVPIWTVVLAHVLTRDERITPGKAGGVLLGFAGVAVMIGPGALIHGSGHLGAQALSLGAALSYAFAAILGRRLLSGRITPMQSATGTMIAATAILLPLALIVDRPWSVPMPGTAAIASILALGSLSTALAYVVFYRLLATVGAVNLVTVTLLVPVSAILLGWVVLGEALSLREFAGMALIALGLAAIDGRPLQARRG